MAYEMVMPYHLHMPSYFLETFTEYPSLKKAAWIVNSIQAVFLFFIFVIPVNIPDSDIH